MKNIHRFFTNFFIFSLISLLQLPLFASLLAQPVAAQTNEVTPQFNCLAADCPNKPVASNSSPLASPAPSNIAGSPVSSNISPQPCDSSSLSSLQFAAQHPSQKGSKNQNGGNKKDRGSKYGNNNTGGDYSRNDSNDRGGFLESFFQFFLTLIVLLLEKTGTGGLTSPCIPTVSVPPVVSPAPSVAVAVSPVPATSSGQPTTVTKVEKTSNWAGYAIQAPPSTNGYITTNWNVTKMDCTAGKGHASSWPGMGGRANDPNISQVGTAEICVADSNNVLQPSYYGWTESFPNPVAPTDDAKYPVAIGDQMTATITFQGSGKFATVMTNKTKGWTLNTPMSFAASYVPKSSEIITESSDNYPIVPKFDTITYPNNVYSPDGTQKLPLGSAPSLVKVTNTTQAGLLRTDASPISGDTFNTPWTHN